MGGPINQGTSRNVEASFGPKGSRMPLLAAVALLECACMGVPGLKRLSLYTYLLMGSSAWSRSSVAVTTAVAVLNKMKKPDTSTSCWLIVYAHHTRTTIRMKSPLESSPLAALHLWEPSGCVSLRHNPRPFEPWFAPAGHAPWAVAGAEDPWFHAWARPLSR